MRALVRTIGIVAVCAETVARIESATGCEMIMRPTSPRASSAAKKAVTSAGETFASTTRKFAPDESRWPTPASKKPVTVSSAERAAAAAAAARRRREACAKGGAERERAR